ncbi:MAG: hypothetical protein CM15mP120_20610 [Pseudomonadota bacterium]|nr:MAG: hypothetical protein CM15mP120_20610 [Pseudomonadota bacterium]
MAPVVERVLAQDAFVADYLLTVPEFAHEAYKFTFALEARKVHIHSFPAQGDTLARPNANRPSERLFKVEPIEAVITGWRVFRLVPEVPMYSFSVTAATAPHKAEISL